MAEKGAQEPAAAEVSPRGRLLGLAAAGLAATIWASWIVATRQATAPAHGAAATPLDIAWLRFSAPALLLAPIWAAPLLRGDGWRATILPNGLAPALLIGLCAWGAPFAIVAAFGAARADATLFGALVPGAMPLWAALIGWLWFRDRVGGARRIGLVLILAAAALGLWSAQNVLAVGTIGALCGAAILWAAYAVAFSRAGLTPAHATGLIGALSCLTLAPLSLVLPSNLAVMPAGELAWQILMQGVVSGVVSVVAYGIALEKLGPGAAATAALVPPLAALIGWAWLGEAPGAAGFAAALLAGIGVLLATAGASIAERLSPR